MFSNAVMAARRSIFGSRSQGISTENLRAFFQNFLNINSLRVINDKLTKFRFFYSFYIVNNNCNFLYATITL